MDQEAVSPMAGARSDATLVALARSGDQSAWSAIVELHWKQVWRLCRIVVRDRNGAEEAAQETFRAVRERLGSFPGDGTLCSWVQAVCRERALDELRRRRRQHREAAADDRDAARPEVERALAGLEPEEREALLLTEAGSTPEDLAAALGVGVATIGSRVARARSRLLDQLGEGGGA